MINVRVERTFSLFLYLTFNRNKSVNALAEMLGTSVSTIYRYIELFKELGFELSAEYGTVYRIISFPSEFRKLFELPMNGDVPGWMAGLKSVNVEDSSTYEVLTEFRENSAFTKVPYLRHYTENANNLIRASKDKKVVILHRYEHDETGEFCDVKVEPYDFGWYFNYLWAYNTRTMKNELFKVTQIGDVEILDQDWTEEKRHKKQKMDVFGVFGHKTTRVRLSLSMRAKNRLIDEHPMAIRAVQRIGECARWEFDAGVCGYRELARFCQGFVGEIEILEGEGLKEYLVSYMEVQLEIMKQKKANNRLIMDNRLLVLPALKAENEERKVERRKLERRQIMAGVVQTA